MALFPPATPAAAGIRSPPAEWRVAAGGLLEYCHQAHGSGDSQGVEHKDDPIFLAHGALYARVVEEVACR
jgi:hypothetical protein